MVPSDSRSLLIADDITADSLLCQSTLLKGETRCHDVFVHLSDRRRVNAVALVGKWS
jgi:hypothetical protein